MSEQVEVTETELSRQEPGQSLWWWAGSEAEARRRFRERFGYEPTVMAMPQPGIVALGPVMGHL